MRAGHRKGWRYTSSGRIVIVGDLHGYFPGFVDVLKAAELIDEHHDWIGGSTTLVQMGDLFGRGDYGRACAGLLMGLQRQARAVGGLVLTLLGNHEAMITHKVLRYLPPTELVSLIAGPIDDCDIQAEVDRAVSMRTRLGRWLRSLPAVITVDDYVFVHAGLERRWAKYGIDWLNRRTREHMAVEGHYSSLPTSSPLCMEDGPLWNRRFVCDDRDGQIGEDLAGTLGDLEASVMIIAHTPSALISGGEGGRAVRRFSDQLITADLGINPLYGGYCSWLEIEDGQLRERSSQPTISELVAID